MVNEDLEIMEANIKISLEGPYPEIFFSDRVPEILDKSMDLTVVVRLLGRTIGYKALLNRIQTLWKLVRSFQVIDIDNDYYLSRDFSTNKQHPSKIVVWMRMSGLPYRYYNKKLLRIIARTLEKVVKVNYNTTKSRREKFARFAIVVDLMKPLKAFVGINNVPFCFQCEGLPLICYKYGCYGHLQERCPSERNEPEEARPAGSASRSSPPSIERIMAGQKCFGLWTQAPGWKQ
ncbi:uncharacterized protein LOC108477588 [Gossypium arboreum]|uniref:uncharacterized protein LOC108477588 n=1 Tax=Gossypium arboreum TaxID=29729 RepID=UPI000819775B|nr:uncharacterized protein LOC108477588 [Gossypium arboreum]